MQAEPRADRHVGHGHDQRLALHAREGQVDVAGPAVLAVAVQRHIGQLRHNAVDELVRHLLDARVVLRHLLLADLRRAAQTLRSTHVTALTTTSGVGSVPER